LLCRKVDRVIEMKKNIQIKNWWIDAVMLAGYLFCFYLEFTGVIGHEWLGVGVGLLAILHTWLHRDWVMKVTRRFFSGAGGRSRWYYLVDVLILIGFIVILETGVVISTWLNLDLAEYAAWLDIHTFASITTLALLAVKVAIHWRWVVNITNKIFSAEPKSMPVPVPVPVNRQAVDRRRFLGLMGVVGMGSLLAVINVARENSIYQTSSDVSASALGTVEDPVTNIPVATAEAGAQSSPAAAEQTMTGVVETAPPTSTGTPTTVPTAEYVQETQPVVAACQVRCSKGCSFPGRCRRYVDQNGNRLCDLGECL